MNEEYPNLNRFLKLKLCFFEKMTLFQIRSKISELYELASNELKDINDVRLAIDQISISIEEYRCFVGNQKDPFSKYGLEVGDIEGIGEHDTRILPLKARALISQDFYEENFVSHFGNSPASINCLVYYVNYNLLKSYENLHGELKSNNDIIINNVDVIKFNHSAEYIGSFINVLRGVSIITTSAKKIVGALVKHIHSGRCKPLTNNTFTRAIGDGKKVSEEGFLTSLEGLKNLVNDNSLKTIELDYDPNADSKQNKIGNYETVNVNMSAEEFALFIRLLQLCKIIDLNYYQTSFNVFYKAFRLNGNVIDLAQFKFDFLYAEDISKNNLNKIIDNMINYTNSYSADK